MTNIKDILKKAAKQYKVVLDAKDIKYLSSRIEKEVKDGLSEFDAIEYVCRIILPTLK